MNPEERVEPGAIKHPYLQIRKQGGQLAHLGGACPACGGYLAPDAVVCVHCGYNRTTGRRIPTYRRHAARGWKVRVGLAFGLVVGLAALVPYALRWYREGQKELQRERIRQALAAMNEQYPVFLVGETVTLRRVSGVVVKGVLVGMGPEGVLVQSSQGSIATFPFYLFDEATRLRLDEGLRRNVLREQAALPEPWWERLWLLAVRPPFVFDAIRAERIAAARPCAFCKDTGKVPCPTCGARGTVATQGRKPCPPCRGTGTHVARMSGGPAPCPYCRGAGYLSDTHSEPCATCKSAGQIPCSRCAAPRP